LWKNKNKSLIYFIKKNYYLAKKTFQICNNEKIDFLFSPDKHVIIDWILKLFFKFKLILRTGGITAEVLPLENKFYSKNIILFFLKIYQRIAYLLPDKIISISKEELLMVQKYTYRKDICVIYHGVNTSLYYIKKRNKQKKIVIGFFGRFCPINNPTLFLEILDSVNQHKKCKGLWIGQTYDYSKKEVSKILNKFKDVDFELKGPFYGLDLIKEISKIDLFLFTGNLIGIGRSILEAASCGLPIVAINKAKLPIGNFVKDKYDAIKIITEMMDLTSLSKEGRINRKYVLENFSLDKQYSKILDLVFDD
jgi:glycosyltransferase involved in cell wall biosynthesis